MENQPLEWSALFDAMRHTPGQWIGTTGAMFWQMLECVPPRAQTRDAFLCGEPYTHNAAGLPVYACFRSHSGGYSAQYMTAPEFAAEFGTGTQ